MGDQGEPGVMTETSSAQRDSPVIVSFPWSPDDQTVSLSDTTSCGGGSGRRTWII